ncbi:MAG: ParB N-terminal domain-containing protein [Phycisphaerae bacterium]
MEIKKMRLSQIQIANYNPRVELKPGDPAYEKLKNSIQTFGFCEPLIFNIRTGNLVGGHQRLTVLKDLGYTEAEVVVVELPLEQEKAFNIALNKIQGDWDERKLALLLDELTKAPEFNVELTGFETEEISDLLDRALTADLTQTREENFDVEEALDRENPAVTQPGELIELGNHHLLCGDSGKLSALKKLIRNDKVHLFFTDPPYNCNYYSGNRPQPEKAQPKQSRQWKPIYSDNVNQDEYIKWLGTVLRNVGTVESPPQHKS